MRAPSDQSRRGLDSIARPAQAGDCRRVVRGPLATWATAPSRSILDQDVVAAPVVEDVLPRPADQDIVAGATEERVVAGAADQEVVAIPAVLREEDRAGREA